MCGCSEQKYLYSPAAVKVKEKVLSVSIAFDRNFFVEWPKTHRPHQVRLEGGDCSSDSYCYP